MERYVASVVIHAANYPLDKAYSYLIPPALLRTHLEGCRAVVPFGRGNRRRVGMIIGISELPPDGAKGLKELYAIPDAAPVLDTEQLMMVRWLRENTFCSWYDAVRTLLPSALQLRVQEHYALAKQETAGLSEAAEKLYQFLSRARSPKELDAMLETGGEPEKADAIRELTEAGLLQREAETQVRVKGKKIRMCSLSPEAPAVSLTPKQQQVADALREFGTLSEKELCYICGVTGSGKTSVFEALIERTLSIGKTALLLLPEIGLTPQMMRRFSARFGKQIAVVHSGLSLTERRRSYERARAGEARLVIGTRSAVFTPLPDLGLIIMDEEGERSYKSDAAPRYDTIQVAKQRAKYHGAVLLPASATPTLESYYYAKQGYYELLEMKQRYGNAVLPSVETIDMTQERQAGNDSEFSNALHDALAENLGRGEQSILLLNRRGYHTIISCCTCNQPVYCDNCSVPMTLHKTDGNLHCHYCGSIRRMPEVCPKCGSQHLRRMGFGTQRLEDELAVRFPKARILRMDADTTGTRLAYEQGFEAFRKGEYDIMLGTQMIGKGLDFPNVTLVGVMSVDKALYAGDFRSYERTFSLITQVVGRGGRGGKPGRAILQTFMPEHYVLRLAAQQDYEAFAEKEFRIRKTLLFPPFCDICVIGISGEQDKDAAAGAQVMLESLREQLALEEKKPPLRVLGPMPCSYQKLGGRYRYRIIIKCRNSAALRSYLQKAMQLASSRREASRVHIYADMNGSIGI